MVTFYEDNDTANRPGHAPPERSAAYVATGLLCLLYAAALIAWVVHGFWVTDVSVTDAAKALYDPAAPLPHLFLTPYEWVLTVVLLIVGVLALMRRTVARGAALVTGALLLVAGVRAAVALRRSGFRSGVDDIPLGHWYSGTLAGALLIGLIVVVLMGRATDRDDVTLARGPLRGAGALLLVGGAAAVAWKVYELRQYDFAWPDDDVRYLTHAPSYLLVLPDSAEHYLRAVADPTDIASALLSAPYFYQAAIAVALLAVGVLALTGRGWARGAALVLAFVELYWTARSGYSWSQADQWTDRAFDGTANSLHTATYLFNGVAALVVFGLVGLARDRELPEEPAYSASEAPTEPGGVFGSPTIPSN